MAGDPLKAREEAHDGFGSTDWSLVLSAQKNEDQGAALNKLCHAYWRPVYVFARRDGLAEHDAEDATQEFFTYILDRSWLDHAGEERGSFRGFLYALLRNFLSNRRRKDNAQKRSGPRAIPSSFNNDKAELENLVAREMDPATAYDQVWAMSVRRCALDRLADEQLRSPQGARFKALSPFLVHPPSSADYEKLASELGQSRNQIAVALHRLSRRYGELIRTEVSSTLENPAQVETELRRLIAVLPH
jgi:RNA polymerase sigma factor (sigma-70 family)